MEKAKKIFDWRVNLCRNLHQPCKVLAAKSDKTVSEYVSEIVAEKVKIEMGNVGGN